MYKNVLIACREDIQWKITGQNPWNAFVETADNIYMDTQTAMDVQSLYVRIAAW